MDRDTKHTTAFHADISVSFPINSREDYTAALADPSLMIIDCMATWCGPCKAIAPKIVEFSNQYPAARFYKIDVDELPDIAQELGVRAMPTFVVFKNGEKINEVVGANPKAIEAAVVKHLDT
ncbi:MAG: hypothetical protein Q9163_005860 [Psora crenata]